MGCDGAAGGPPDDCWGFLPLSFKGRPKECASKGFNPLLWLWGLIKAAYGLKDAPRS